MKQFPKLTVVPKPVPEKQGTAQAPSFELLALRDFREEERRLIRAFVQATAPHDSLVAGVRTGTPWDIRAVVLAEGHETPSLLRKLGPQVAENQAVRAEVERTLFELSNHPEVDSGLEGWGNWQGQSWFRRPLVDLTLDQQLQGHTDWTPDPFELFQLGFRVAQEIQLWHSLGFCHGHIVPSNVWLLAADKLRLLDGGVAYALISASAGNALYLRSTFAPEVWSASSLSPTVDIFGLGIILKTIGRSIIASGGSFEREAGQASVITEALSTIAPRFLQQAPSKRPDIDGALGELAAAAARIGLALPERERLGLSDVELGVSVERAKVVGQREFKEPGTRIEHGAVVGSRSADIRAERQPGYSSVQSTRAQDFLAPANEGGREGSGGYRSSGKGLAESWSVEDTSAAASARDPLTSQNYARVGDSGGEPSVSFELEGAAAHSASAHAQPSYHGQHGSGAAATGTAVQGSGAFERRESTVFDQGQMQLAQGAPVQGPIYSSVAPQFQAAAQPAIGPHGMLHGMPHQNLGQAVPPQGFPIGYAPPVYGQIAYQNASLPLSHSIPNPMMSGYMVPPGYPQPVPHPQAYGQQPLVPQAGGVAQSAPAPNVTKKETGLFPLLVFFSLALVGLWLYRSGHLEEVSERLGYGTSEAELRDAWQSGIPSRMLPVALAALDKEHPDARAELVIVNSVLRGENPQSAVNTGLLRVAFDGRWEMELSPQDRRIALTLGLSDLLGERIANEHADLTKLHPGVILALLAHGGRSMGKVFNAVPAEALAKLPPPYGPAFKELLRSAGMVSCGDDSVIELAQVAVRGIRGVDDIVSFLSKEPRERLRLLALVYSQDNAGAQKVLDVLLEHPNLSVDLEPVKWAKMWKVMTWSELESSDKLFVLAGIPPATVMAPEHLGTTVAHPEPAMRSFAIHSVRETVKMAHPGAYDALKRLEAEPEVLSPKQTLELARFLENPANATPAMIDEWFKAEPAISLVAPLLLATATQSEGTPLDTGIAMYLKSKDWKPDVAKLRKLSTHPDKFTRLFAYNEIYTLADKDTAKDFLSSALTKETDPVYQARLHEMLGGL